MFSYILKNTKIRTLYCIARYVIFCKLLKNYKFLNHDVTIENSFLKKKNINFPKHKYLDDKKFLDLTTKYEKRNLIIRNFRELLRNFNGKRVFRLISKLDLKRNDYAKMRVLSVGPRNEGELYSLISLGVKKKNIYAVDIHSYSPMIKLDTIEKMNFPEIEFDLILVGWVLIYCKDLEKAISNLIKNSSKNTTICFGSSIKNEEDNQVANENILKILKTNLKQNFKIIHSYRHQNTYDLLAIKIM